MLLRWRSAAPGRWLGRAQRRTTLVVTVGLLYATALMLSLVAQATPPRFTLTLTAAVPGEAAVAWLQPGNALWDHGVRPGDRVLALDGRAPTSRDTGSWSGTRLLVRVGGAEGSHGPILLNAAPWQDRSTVPVLLLSPWFLLLGTLVVLRARRLDVAWATYALFSSAAFALALAPAADAGVPVAVPVEFTLVGLFAACFMRFFLVFPSRRGAASLHGTILGAALLVGLLDFAALIWPGLYAVASLLRSVLLVVFLLGGLALLVRARVTAPERATRRGLDLLSLGATLAVLPFVTLYLVPTLAQRPPLMAAEQAILALGLLPASFAYVILRHKALQAPLVQRWFVRGLLWTVLLAVYVVVVVVAQWLLAALTAPSRTVALAGVCALTAGLLMGWGRVGAQRLLDRLLFKDTYEYRAALRTLSQDLALLGNLDALGAELCRLMNLEFAVVLTRTGVGASVLSAAGRYQPALLAALAEAAPSGAVGPRTVALADGAAPVLLVALSTPTGVVGHLCLGPKASGEPFGSADAALLATLSGHLAAVVRNVQLVEELRLKASTLDALNARFAHTQEEERARLAADLHDEPLQTALDLHRQLSVLETQPALTALSQTLLAQLRAQCTAMRPAALDDLGLHAALDQLAQDVSTRAGVVIVLDANPEIAELGLSAAQELVLYRATQEALTNSVRHAGAATVQVTLQRHGLGVRLRVSDDGGGFAVPARLELLAREGHLGLAGLATRVRHAGGSLHVTSAAHAGTCIQVDLPADGGGQRA